MTRTLAYGLLLLPVSMTLVGCVPGEAPPMTLTAKDTNAHPRANIEVDTIHDGGTLIPGIAIAQSQYVKPQDYVRYVACPNHAFEIKGDNIVVDFQGATLVGSPKETTPDKFSGVGLKIQGNNITVRNLNIRGYKAGILALNCDGLIIEDVDLSNNFRQYLNSTPQVEDPSDWLKPHNNDEKQWGMNYGAGIYVADSSNVLIRRAFIHNGQNGIILDNVRQSKIFDNDCSFLSGWGLAMWRSSNNIITRNAFDFCVRGYSEKKYNQGQNSAGVLMYEQCNNNIIADNSMTHCGAGITVYAGEEATGKINPSSDNFDHRRMGCNENLFVFNDCSYSATNGLECTFSFGNIIFGNRFVSNSICGVLGSYSQFTQIRRNMFEKNGKIPFGRVRGGIDLQSGAHNSIESNMFSGDACGVYIWTDFSDEIFKLPWAVANHKGAIANKISHNLFEDVDVAIHLKNTERTMMVDNQFTDCNKKVWRQGKTAPTEEEGKRKPRFATPAYPSYGVTSPVGGRRNLDGRQQIIMTEWGPYDHEGVAVVPTRIVGGKQALISIYGMGGSYKTTNIKGDVQVMNRSGSLPGLIVVKAPGKGVYPFSMDVNAKEEQFQVKGTMVNAGWNIQFFKWDPLSDPRKNPEAWEKLIQGKPLAEKTNQAELKLRCGNECPDNKVPKDYFGTVATTELDLPAGTYSIRSISDDGVRVWVDGELVIDNWAQHQSGAVSVATLKLSKGNHKFRVEHFEIEGVARLEVTIEP